MTAEKMNAVARYLKSGSGGTFLGRDSYEVLMLALKHSGITGISGEEFAKVLRGYGITPDVRGGSYILVLPSRPN